MADNSNLEYLPPDYDPVIEVIDGYRIWDYLVLDVDGTEQLFAWTLADVFLALPDKCTEHGFWRAGTWFASMVELEEAQEEKRGFLGPAQGRVLKLAEHIQLHGRKVKLGMIH
jgi:hypothetical protein